MHVLQQDMHIVQQARFRLSQPGIRVALVAAVFGAFVMLACGGSTTALPAGCTGAFANNGCYGLVRWSHPSDFGGAANINGAYTSMYIAPMTCAAGCTGPNAQYIANQMFMVSASGGQFVTVGYRSNGANLQYFDGYSFDGSGIPHYTNINQVDAGDVSHYANFAINRLQFPGGAAYPDGFVVRIKSQTAAFTAVPPLVGTGSNFAPGWLELGQLVHGTHDIAAESSFFNHNRFTTTLVTSAPVNAPDITVAGPDQTLFNGVVSTDGVIVMDSPPYGGWFARPTLPSGDLLYQPGGEFYVECCKPL